MELRDEGWKQRKARAKYLSYNYSCSFLTTGVSPLPHLNQLNPTDPGDAANRALQEMCPNPDQSHISPWGWIHSSGWPVAGCPWESGSPGELPDLKGASAHGAMSICLSVHQHILSWLSDTAPVYVAARSIFSP